jgi:hypothetical protein
MRRGPLGFARGFGKEEQALRLRGCSASRSIHCAQDDTFLGGHLVVNIAFTDDLLKS